jgi:perosamine synthetase
MFKIPVYQPDLTGNESIYVNECIKSNWISSKGRFISDFEKQFAHKTGVSYTTSVSNGTVALHLALLALGIKDGDEVIVPTLTYVASVNAIRYCNAVPVFADSEPSRWQLDPQSIEAKITSKTRAIIVVHLYGQSCNMDHILKIASKYGLFVVEDCAEAIGTLYKGRHVGNYGNIATFSFFGNKTITTGEGGMVVSNSPSLIERAIHFKGQGLVKDRQYWHDVIGYNYRMTNIQAAIGLAQIERVDQLLSMKSEIARQYREAMHGLPVVFQEDDPDTRHSYWMVSILLSNTEQRDSLRKYLEQNSVETRPIFFPVHTMPMYSSDQLSLPVAEKISSRGINLPSWPGLSANDIAFISELIEKFIKKSNSR